MKITRITGEGCQALRSLWEEVFWEDSAAFTEYYFINKANKNIGYAIGTPPYDGMLFRTPYRLQIGRTEREISYLVGVATRESCRHRGYMKTLLLHSFQEMYREKQPFTFLMPADPAIYTPFGFRYIYEREVWSFKEPEGVQKKELRAAEEKTMRQGLQSVRELLQCFPQFPILDALAEFANSCLKDRYEIYAVRDRAYYEMQLKELQAQNGDIFVWLEDGHIQAFFLYAKEEETIFLQEVVDPQNRLEPILQKEKSTKPVIMARILHIQEMMALVQSQEEKTIVIEIRDAWIAQNNGIFCWKMTPWGSQVTEAAFGQKPEISMDICELTPQLLKKVFLNEIV